MTDIERLQLELVKVERILQQLLVKAKAFEDFVRRETCICSTENDYTCERCELLGERFGRPLT